MAAELPIVSTPVADVVELYGEVVSIADTPAAFIRACESALLTTPEDNTQTIMRMREMVSATSWNTTAEKMHELMQVAALQNEGSSRGVRRFMEPESLIHRNMEPVPAENRKFVIIGAGPTGLSAAYHLDEETLLLDKNSIVGGWCRSIEDKGFTFDHAGHIMFSNDAAMPSALQDSARR